MKRLSRHLPVAAVSPVADLWPIAAVWLILASILRPDVALADMQSADQALEERIAACTDQTGYSESRASGLGENELGKGEREWRACVYKGIETIMLPATAIPDTYRMLVTRDKVMTNLIERGEMTRTQRRKTLDRLISQLQQEENSVAAAAPVDPELDKLRADAIRYGKEMRTMRSIESAFSR